ncbi:MAG TPA: DUF3108 domain-containing protein [Vicinamibacterales bacterium]|nr:DUF3108 domain-containing protein [Vicinamibacterales bacterium]
MRRLPPFLVLAVVTLVGLDSAHGQTARKAAEMLVPFKVGEALTYEVSWSSYLTAGTVTLTVQDKHPSYSSVAYYVVAEARPTPLMSRLYTLYYKADALIDSYTVLPQRGSVYSEEGKRHLLKATMFNQSAHKAVFENVTAKTSRELTVPAYTQDPLSALYILRALPLKPGSHTTIPMSTGGRVYRAEVYVDALETAKTPAGPFEAFPLRALVFDERGQPAGRPVMLWISNTPARLPVKLRFDLAIGSFNLSLSNVGGGPAQLQ